MDSDQLVSQPAGRLTLSVRETCAALGVSRSTVYRLLKDERLRSVHIGRRVLIPVSEIRRLIGPNGSSDLS